jgi:hypothetical protein
MSRSWSEKRVLVAWTAAGLVVGVLLSIGLVWNYVGRYFWREDGSLSTGAFAANPRLRHNPSTGSVDLIEPPVRRPLSPSEKVWIGCQESLPIWLAGGTFGFCAGMIHLRIRTRRRAADPERQNYDDSINSKRPPST